MTRTVIASLSSAVALSSSLLLLSACGAYTASPAALASFANASGAWQIGSSSAVAAKLPLLGGVLVVTGASVAGSFAPLVPTGISATLCAPPATTFHVKGTVSPSGVMSLTSTDFSGGAVTISGSLAADHRSFTSATYSVVNGACAFASPAPAVATLYTPPQGYYSGTFPGDPASGGAPFKVILDIASDHQPTNDPTSPVILSEASVYYLGQTVCAGPNVIYTVLFFTTGGQFSFPSPLMNVNIAGTFTPDGQTITSTFSFISGDCAGATGTIDLLFTSLTPPPTP